jgi:hypothetical protein
MATQLYHFTCDHGRQALGAVGQVTPLAVWNPAAASKLPDAWVWVSGFCWFTDMAWPDPVALGLTSSTLVCDRTRWRYLVTDDANVKPYIQVARNWLPPQAWKLTIGDHQPGRWWLSRVPVPVVVDMSYARPS